MHVRYKCRDSAFEHLTGILVDEFEEVLNGKKNNKLTHICTCIGWMTVTKDEKRDKKHLKYEKVLFLILFYLRAGNGRG